MGSICIPCYEEGENDSLDSSECLFCPHYDCKIHDDGRNAEFHFCSIANVMFTLSIR